MLALDMPKHLTPKTLSLVLFFCNLLFLCMHLFNIWYVERGCYRIMRFSVKMRG